MRSVIKNADILSRYIQPVLDSVITGNFSLARVLPAIYAVDKQLINNHVMTLVSLLMKRSDTENMVLLNLFGLVAKDSPVLLEPSIPQLCECLGQQSTAAPTLRTSPGPGLSVWRTTWRTSRQRPSPCPHCR